MKKAFVSVLAAAALPLAACNTVDDRTLASATTGAAVGGAVGAGAGAVIGGLSVLEGAVIGAAVGGLAGAVWADRTGDGRADGYIYNGQYYEGAPAGYQAAGSAPCPPFGPTGTATVGASVPGLPGAVWADTNADGCADGYYRDGQYYAGAPVIQPLPATYTGERG
jgi:hypothetical protein